MTKKDYIAIANILKDIHKEYNLATGNNTEALEVWLSIVRQLKYLFKIDNDNFDDLRFWNYVFDNSKRYKDFTDGLHTTYKGRMVAK